MAENQKGSPMDNRELTEDEMSIVKEITTTISNRFDAINASKTTNELHEVLSKLTADIEKIDEDEEKSNVFDNLMNVLNF